MLKYRRLFIDTIVLVLLLALSACSDAESTRPAESADGLPLETAVVATSTPFQPSPTPIPLAARVNGEPLLLSTYQAELARYTAALGIDPPWKSSSRCLTT